MARALRLFNIGDQDLDIAVATEPALAGHLADVTDFGTTKKSALNGLVLLAKLGKHRNEIVCFILHDCVSCQSSVRSNLSLLRGSAALLQHLVQPRRHLLFMSMGSQLRTLRIK